MKLHNSGLQKTLGFYILQRCLFFNPGFLQKKIGGAKRMAIFFFLILWFSFITKSKISYVTYFNVKTKSL